MRLDAFADEDLGEKRASVLKTPVPWLAVGKYDDSSELCHFDQVLLIVWPDRGLPIELSKFRQFK